MFFYQFYSSIIERFLFDVDRLIVMFIFVSRDDQVSDLNPESRLEYVGILRWQSLFLKMHFPDDILLEEMFAELKKCISWVTFSWKSNNNVFSPFSSTRVRQKLN